MEPSTGSPGREERRRRRVLAAGLRPLRALAGSRRRRAAAAVVGVIAALLLLVSQCGDFLREQTPEQVRQLPGVRAVIGTAPPHYADSVFGLRAPLSVAVTENGEFLYVAEGAGARVVRKIRLSDGEQVADLAPPGIAVGQRKPVSVAVAPTGVVYVVDRLRRMVDIYAPDGQWLGLLPSVSGGPWEPLNVDTDPDGYVYVTNTAEGGPVLTVYSPDGTVAEQYRVIVAEGIPVSYATGVAPDSDGRLWIGDSNNGRLVALRRGEFTGRSYGNAPGVASLAMPRGVAIDEHGFALVADAVDHSIAAWDVSGKDASLLFRFGEPGINDGAFLFPNDITVDGRGWLYIADRDNDRVQIWRY